MLPEIFGLNGWVPALAMPLFARTAPDLELGYDPEATREGRRHKEATSTEQILADVQASIDWLREALETRDQYHQASAQEGWRLLLEAAQS